VSDKPVGPVKIVELRPLAAAALLRVSVSAARTSAADFSGIGGGGGGGGGADCFGDEKIPPMIIFLVKQI
tara:strand:- start:1867 stop:2076 length:210 start_codon:yes stop_codon:yes gene_type:complete